MYMDLNRATVGPLGTQSQEGEQIGEVGKPFGFASFARGQALALVLFVQQRVKPFLDSVGQAELCEVAGQLNLELNTLLHTRKS